MPKEFSRGQRVAEQVRRELAELKELPAPGERDWAALEKPLREEFASPRIEWQADAAVPPGDCLVESAGMQIDGTLDKRWRRAIAALGLTAAWREDGHAD